MAEGNPDKVARLMGANWLKRKAMKAAKWGIGRIFVRLRQHGDKFHITCTTPLGKSTVRFVVGKGKQRATATDGGHYVLEPRWEGPAVVSTLQRAGKIVTSRRSMRRGQMVIETNIQGASASDV
eukprot:TRINITY_DN18347_c0_g1_i1.p2 TRINITY_DN18347_c0_g1~~TRINITY_DN18347_c0_g1_i1.p2  ORF type:complete len:124 (-),score=26.98 TRINITY_DN18347_c0_g1_i1:57-428(-)